MLISTNPSWETCGVTTSVMPVLIFSVAVLADPAAPPEPLFAPKPEPKLPGTGKSARNGTELPGAPLRPGDGAPLPRPEPPRPTVPGKLAPVGLPVAGPALNR